jgi:hypothetical protein
VELTFPGEDELCLTVKSVNSGSRQVIFDALPHPPPVARGAAVLGVGGFSTTLDADLTQSKHPGLRELRERDVPDLAEDVAAEEPCLTGAA